MLRNRYLASSGISIFIPVRAQSFAFSYWLWTFFINAGRFLIDIYFDNMHSPSWGGIDISFDPATDDISACFCRFHDSFYLDLLVLGCWPVFFKLSTGCARVMLGIAVPFLFIRYWKEDYVRCILSFPIVHGIVRLSACIWNISLIIWTCMLWNRLRARLFRNSFDEMVDRLVARPFVRTFYSLKIY